MKCLVVYDIVSDSRRKRIADICLDYGLDRFQYSSFLGDLRNIHRRELSAQLEQALCGTVGNIQIFSICAKDWEERIEFSSKEEGSD